MATRCRADLGLCDWTNSCLESGSWGLATIVWIVVSGVFILESEKVRIEEIISIAIYRTSALSLEQNGTFVKNMKSLKM